MCKFVVGGVTGVIACLCVWVGAATPAVRPWGTATWGTRVGDAGMARAHQAQGDTARPVPPAPTDQAMYIANSEIQSTWKDLEAGHVIARRMMEGGAYSINTRIVRERDPPWIHSQMCDVWIVQTGSATAITGGQLLGGKKNLQNEDVVGSSISGGMEQSLQPGDILYVPPGVPHGFKNAKGFRAYVIHFNTK
ncbi:MAG TPA: AraC family ligand binding domain-containing protein [Gemmatimonadales bacterium]|nr:AraC family ligand binding domain-containing protein [Gemmatimonadales bacterium]